MAVSTFILWPDQPLFGKLRQKGDGWTRRKGIFLLLRAIGLAARGTRDLPVATMVAPVARICFSFRSRSWPAFRLGQIVDAGATAAPSALLLNSTTPRLADRKQVVHLPRILAISVTDRNYRPNPRQLLRAIPNLKMVFELKESTWCCGSAGIYI